MLQKSLELAEVIDAFRIFPRLILFGFSVLVGYVVFWFTGLEAPNTQQAAFVSTVVGIIAPVTAFYLQTGRKWSRD